MGVEHQHPASAGGAPVGEVVLGEPAGLVGVSHLCCGAAAAPLLGHQAELVAGALEDLGYRPRDRRAVEGGLAVHEQDRCAADRKVEPVGPVADVFLADGRVAEHGLVGAFFGRLVPAQPRRLVDALVDGKRSHRLDDVDGAGAEAVEVTGEQCVRAAQLARPALRAVDVVGGHIRDVKVVALDRHDVGVECRRRPRLVARDLHHRAHLAAELVARREAVVGAVVPLRQELRRAFIASGHRRQGNCHRVRLGVPRLVAVARSRCVRLGQRPSPVVCLRHVPRPPREHCEPTERQPGSPTVAVRPRRRGGLVRPLGTCTTAHRGVAQPSPSLAGSGSWPADLRYRVRPRRCGLTRGASHSCARGVCARLRGRCRARWRSVRWWLLRRGGRGSRARVGSTRTGRCGVTLRLARRGTGRRLGR